MLKSKRELEMCANCERIEVVRCRECRYYYNSNETCEMISTRLGFYATDKAWTKDSYCSWGKRRDE